MRETERMNRPLRLLTPLFILFFAPSIFAQEKLPTEVPATIAIEAETANLKESGRFNLHFAIEVKGTIDRNYRLLVSLRSGGKEIATRHHVPLRSTKSWKKGEIIQYTLPTLFPMEANLGSADTITFHVCFQDPRSRKYIPVLGASGGRDVFQTAGFMNAPVFGALEGEENSQALLDRGLSLHKSGDTVAAWDVLELGMRRAKTDTWKRNFLRALLSFKKLAPRPINGVEKQIVATRIANEKTRYLRQIAGRFFDRKKYHASIKILDAIGGSLKEAGDAAVMGDLAGAERREKSKQETKRKIFETISEDDLSLARSEASKLEGKKLLKRADFYIKKKRLAIARHLLRELRLDDNADIRRDAYAQLEKVKETMLASIPPEQSAMVDAAVNHRCWRRTTTRSTQNFILIGPQKLLAGISDESALRFDVAYILITDLFGRRPNPDGDRVTVYFKELWDFGGGTGGGKTINIGNADPNRSKQRLDTGLFYHEFSHCVDDTSPIIAGWREGLADFGAVYAFHMIGQKQEASRRFRSYKQAFQDDYLDRDLEYWRIPNYAPSAGFFTHFVQKAAKKTKGKLDWSPYRRFFRSYRNISLRDGREQTLVRGVAFELMSAFGDWIFDDLIKFRFPLVESDREAIRREYLAHAQKSYDEFEDNDTPKKFPNSPVSRDLDFRHLIQVMARVSDNKEEITNIAAEDLGILFDWRVIGPFKGEGADADAQVFPPEWEIDFKKAYNSGSNICKWVSPTEDGPVIQKAHGWLEYKFNYQDYTAIYALSHVSLPKAENVLFHLRADDDVSLFVNDELIGKYHTRGNNGSDRTAWRGPFAKLPDAIRFPVSLRRGRNKILVKVKNRAGASGMICAITRPNGTALPLLMADDQPAVKASETKERKWKKPIKFRFTSRGAARKFDRVVGQFEVINKTLTGTDTSRRVAWRKYTVRPGFPKDSPSNLLWFKKKMTKNMRDFQLKIELESTSAAAPKIGICFDGDGGRDGLGGLTLILHPSGRKNLKGRMERYDRLLYATKGLELPKLGESKTRLLVIERIGANVTVTIDGTVVFDHVHVRPISSKSRLGLMTWGPTTRIHRIDLKVPR